MNFTAPLFEFWCRNKQQFPWRASKTNTGSTKTAPVTTLNVSGTSWKWLEASINFQLVIRAPPQAWKRCFIVFSGSSKFLQTQIFGLRFYLFFFCQFFSVISWIGVNSPSVKQGWGAVDGLHLTHCRSSRTPPVEDPSSRWGSSGGGRSAGSVSSPGVKACSGPRPPNWCCRQISAGAQEGWRWDFASKK